MIVDDLSSSTADGRCELSARVRPAKGEARRLWFRFPVELAPRGELDGSPFLAAALVWCLRRGESLSVEAPVSPRLLDTMDTILGVYRSLRPEQTSDISVTAPAGLPPEPNELTACFFARGVDSWFAALTALDEDPQIPPLTHAVHSPDFVPAVWSQALVDEKVAATREAAEATGLEFLQIETNLKRDFGGAQLVSSALALGYTRMLIPSGGMRGEVTPRGTHVALDHLFSTERTEIVHYGDASRLQKVARIARSDRVLGTLRVCRDNDFPVDGNCGRCEKCVRTMLELHAVGALGRCPTFARPLDPQGVARIGNPPLRARQRHQWNDIIHALEDTAFNRRIIAAMRLVLARSALRTAIDDMQTVAQEAELAGLGTGLTASVRAVKFGSRVGHRALGTLLAPAEADSNGRSADSVPALAREAVDALGRSIRARRTRPGSPSGTQSSSAASSSGSVTGRRQAKRSHT